jgi:glycosyltransferase involved in cell wall biosynthesis
MFFSFLIASKNEEVDIKNIINSCLDQNYKKFEIIIVDDSTDNTRSIIQNYKNTSIKLIEGENKGCCNARNLGIIKSIGDVIVFLTADTILPKDYLENILRHYENGYDWVTVSSQILNQKYIFPLFIEAQHKNNEDKIKNFYTTQGYSVKKKSALEVNMISGETYPFNFCRDWTLGEKLTKKKYKKIHDKNIIVFHNSPYQLNDFWNVRKTRGLMSAYQPYYFFNKSISYLFFKFAVKSTLSLFKIIFVVPLIYNLFKISRYSDNKIKNFFLFLLPYLIQEFAFRYGEFNGLSKIINREKK